MSLIDCPICFDSKPSIEITTLPCNCQACSGCLCDWITMKIQEQGRTVDQTINCIISACKKPFPIHVVYSNIPSSYQQKLDQALLQGYLSKDKSVRKCPQLGCIYAGIIDLKAKNCKEDINCQLCGTTWRDKSQLTWSQTIQNHFKRMGTSKNETLSFLWKGWKTKKCPNCFVDIQKSEGCSHMTCSRCSHEFCWDCKQQNPKHKIEVHLIRSLIPFGITFGLTVFSLKKFFAIPAVQRVTKSFISPAWNCVKGALGNAVKGTFKFVLTNLAFLGLSAVYNADGSKPKSGFIVFALSSLGLICSLGLHRLILRTLCIDMAMFGGLVLLRRYQQIRYQMQDNPVIDRVEDLYPQDNSFAQIEDPASHGVIADKMVKSNSAPPGSL